MMESYDAEFCRAVLSASLDISKPNKSLAKKLLKKKNDITAEEIRFLAALFLGKLSPEKREGRPEGDNHSTQTKLEAVALIKRYQDEKIGKREEIIQIVRAEKRLSVDADSIKRWISEINALVLKCHNVVSEKDNPISELSKMFGWSEKQIEKVINSKTRKKPSN